MALSFPTTLDDLDRTRGVAAVQSRFLPLLGIPIPVINLTALANPSKDLP